MVELKRRPPAPPPPARIQGSKDPPEEKKAPTKRGVEFGDLPQFLEWLLVTPLETHPADQSLLNLIKKRKMTYLVISAFRLYQKFRGEK